MTYFLPSYFQKRLLRYALSRIDFIESDALDLENLGVTLGQRSVIELKHVGIKVGKIIEKLYLPPSVVPRLASIQTLRLTIPADLHVSGIIVEIDGVEIEVELDGNQLKEKQKSSKSRGDVGRSHTDTANRPSISSPAIHDPGGRARTGDVDADPAHTLPTSEDLAVSFLQTEPEHEKRELQAAIEARSMLMQQSTASLESSYDEAGLGMPGGFSLPGFVANFFAGVVQRLSLTIKNVALTVSLHVSSDTGSPELVKVLFTLKEIQLKALERSTSTESEGRPRRSIQIYGFGLHLLSEPDTFSQRSTSSSPRIAKSHAKLSKDVAGERWESKEQGVPYRESTPTPSSASSISNVSSGIPEFGLGIAGSVMEASQILDTSRVSHTSPLSDKAHDVSLETPTEPGQKYGDSHFTNLRASSGSIGKMDPSDTGLAESQLFTHDEAESMYMSAVSQDFGSTGQMPGGWDDRSIQPQGVQNTTSKQSVDSPDRAGQSTTGPQLSDELSPNNDLQKETSDSPSPEPEPVFPKLLPISGNQNLVAKRLFAVDKVDIQIPDHFSDDRNGPPDSQSQSPRSVAEYGNSSTLRRDHEPSVPSQPMQGSHVRSGSMQSTVNFRHRPTLLPDDDSFYEIYVGSVELAADMSICHLLVATSSTASKILASQEVKSSETRSVPSFGIKSAVESVTINFHQAVPETKFQQIKDVSDMFSSVKLLSDDPLLQLQLSTLEYQSAHKGNFTDQYLSVSRIALKCGTEKVLSFFDPSNIHESFVASSTVIEPHDLVVRKNSDRFDVSIKPVYVKLDLLLIDDVLSRSGGLSYLLDLGNSLASNKTVTDSLPTTTAKSVHRQRSVRFNSSPAKQKVEKDINNAGPKINIRVSGAFVEFVGSEATIQIKTSSVKTVLRPPHLRTSVSQVIVKGPILHNKHNVSDVNIRISDFQIKYLDAPEEEDLDRLLSLLTPSSDKFDKDDDIMVPTLLRQRRKGGVVHVSAKDLQISAKGLGWNQQLIKIAEEISKLSSVAKYLPEDDRPGILTFALIDRFSLNLDFGKGLWPVTLRANLLEGAHITLPALMAAQVSSFFISYANSKPLFGELIPHMQASTLMGPPMLMCRFIADEMDPTVKIKLSNACLEYSVQIVQSFTQFLEFLQKEMSREQSSASPRSSAISSSASETSEFARKVHVSLSLRNTAIGLNPMNSPARGLFVFTEATVGHSNRKEIMNATLDLKRGSVLIIDDVSKIGQETSGADPKLYFDQNDQVQELAKTGFVPVGSISSAFAEVKVLEDSKSKEQVVDIEFRNNLFFLETCADSTQTLIQVLGGLSPPAAPSSIAKYRTQIVPIEDMLASFTGNAFVSETGPELGLQASQISTQSSAVVEENESREDANDEEDDDDGFLNDLYLSQAEDEHNDRMTESYLESEMGESSMGGSVNVAPVNIVADDTDSAGGQSIIANSLLDFRTDHFTSKGSVGGTAHRWDSAKNTYGMESENSVQTSPLKVRVRDVHIIWNLFDGFDWQNTRETISQAVQDIETKAMARQNRLDSRRSPTMEEDDASVIGDVLFNSIYISIPANKDPRELSNAINQDLGDAMSETGSYATSTTVTATTRKPTAARVKPKRLRLDRSKQHKLTFELEGLSADFLMFPPKSGEVESSLDVRVRKLEIFDHVPTSTWKKFATYMHEAGERELGTDMIHIELLNVKPIAELSASEIVMKVTVLPLRLHVDQDALDFMTRFFEFKDDRVAPSTTPATPPFLQRVEVNPIQVRLDFKPKRVDYAGLRSGRTTEFMNFIILDRADMVLRRVILYGVSGFDRLGIMLNSIWMPDVKRNQLPGVLAGLAPIRSLVDVGSGVKDLIAVPIREYKKDGRIVRSIQKGAIAFAKTTTTELVNLGAKLAIGTQTVLQNAEGVLVPGTQQTEEEDEDSRKQISLYADQPLGIVQGLRGAYASLERDLLLAKDAIVAVPGEVMATGSATGAAKAVLKQSPTIVLRPAIGVTKAMGQAFLGAGNTLDKGNRRRVEDKYKRY